MKRQWKRQCVAVASAIAVLLLFAPTTAHATHVAYYERSCPLTKVNGRWYSATIKFSLTDPSGQSGHSYAVSKFGTRVTSATTGANVSTSVKYTVYQYKGGSFVSGYNSKTAMKSNYTYIGWLDYPAFVWIFKSSTGDRWVNVAIQWGTGVGCGISIFPS